MQTFLPFPSFAESARVLDPARLGKQRVETLQILRALIVPTYGWQRHPAVGMWRGHVPALTAYGLAMVDAWDLLGHADTVRDQLAEFAPHVVGRPQEALAADGLLPPWLGDPALHESHRSKLIAKDPVRYRPFFPGTPEGLEYVWPPVETEEPAASPHAPFESLRTSLWVLRMPSAAPWRDYGLVGLPAVSPLGRTPPSWRQQLRALEEELVPGTVVALLADDDPELLHLAEITGRTASAAIDDEPWTAVAARFEGDLERRDLPMPAVLQNPRRLFRIDLLEPLGSAPGSGE